VAEAQVAARKIGVIGAGAWGTALAQTVAGAGRDVVVWAREAEVVETINRTRENKLFLPGAKLDGRITATGDLAQAGACGIVLMVAPAQHTRDVLTRLEPVIAADAAIVLCAKGIERGSAKFMTEVLADCLPRARAFVLSGPSFAADVVRGLPTAVTIAGVAPGATRKIAEIFKTHTFRPYLSDDLIGAQIGGAIKNVLAIASGIVEGKKFGDSARAALITRGFAEMTRLGRKLGAKPETLTGLSGLGDLILTCSSRLSRNMSLGAALGEGVALAEYLAARQSVAEGVYTAGVVVELARQHKIDMPICNGVHAITGLEADVDQTIEALLERPIVAETD
jgi:glycerol-3-phosphate dehydrogenase (NAD(P)+)